VNGTRRPGRSRRCGAARSAVHGVSGTADLRRGASCADRALRQRLPHSSEMS
jgi:hypothetical protein